MFTKRATAQAPKRCLEEAFDSKAKVETQILLDNMLELSGEEAKLPLVFPSQVILVKSYSMSKLSRTPVT